MLPCSVSLLLVLFTTSALASNEFGLKFLEENKGKDGVITLPSGLQYKVLREGEGDAHPLAATSCSCHYEGRTAQEFTKDPVGETFDSRCVLPVGKCGRTDQVVRVF